jgi:hypothetical protein
MPRTIRLRNGKPPWRNVSNHEHAPRIHSPRTHPSSRTATANHQFMKIKMRAMDWL